MTNIDVVIMGILKIAVNLWPVLVGGVVVMILDRMEGK